MPALLTLEDARMRDDDLPAFLGRRRFDDRLKADGFVLTNTGDERSETGARLVVTVTYGHLTELPVSYEALVADIPRLDPGESFGPLTRAFGLEQAEGALYGDALISYAVEAEGEGAPAPDLPEAAATDVVQISPFTNQADNVDLSMKLSGAVWQARGGADEVDASGLILAETDAGVTVLGGGGGDMLLGSAGIDDLKGQNGADVLEGGAGDDLLDGGRGGDEIDGGAGNDRIVGGGGRDVVEGREGDDVISGDGGRDRLGGGSGDDEIDGGKGRDVIDGDSGADILTGGAGKDRFVFDRHDFHGDVITDYQVGEKLYFDRYIKSTDGFELTQVGDDLVIVGDGRFFEEGEPQLTLLDVDIDDFRMKDIQFGPNPIIDL
ncbi:MAG: calcium-binding protein [Pseudomonadota bacterium]|nr:calcium-binding protein [Pseudomonadota bacterium]